MANITIRNLDDRVIATLKQQAKAHNRSLEAEVREILKRDAARIDLVARAELIAAMTPDVPQTDSTKLLREDRDR
jgi:plasmid stability protein